MESLVARPATTWGSAHLTMKCGSALITVTSRSGLILRDNIAAGPPAPPQPITTSFPFVPIVQPPLKYMNAVLQALHLLPQIFSPCLRLSPGLLNKKRYE